MALMSLDLLTLYRYVMSSHGPDEPRSPNPNPNPNISLPLQQVLALSPRGLHKLQSNLIPPDRCQNSNLGRARVTERSSFVLYWALPYWA